MAQHPTFELSLSGQGELVLARLERASAWLVLPSGAERVLVRETVSDQLVAEWVGGGAPSALALPPGGYAITLVAQGQGYGGRLRLDAGERRVLTLDELRRVERATSASREGGLAGPAPARPTSERLELGLMGGGGLGALARVGVESRSGHAITAAVMVGTHQVNEWYVGSSYQARAYTLNARGGYRWLWTCFPYSQVGVGFSVSWAR